MCNDDRLNRPSNRTLHVMGGLCGGAAITSLVTRNWAAAIGFGLLSNAFAAYPVLRIAVFDAGYQQALQDRQPTPEVPRAGVHEGAAR
jgi:hypothetical protein